VTERLLIVEDEETLCESLKRVLSREGYLVDTAFSAETALELLEQGFYDLIITDIILPGITGIELLKIIKEKFPDQNVIITTAYASLETAVEALRTGAYDYVVKPVMHEEIKQIVKNAITQGALREENVRLRRHMETHYNPGMIVAEGPAMRTVMGGMSGAAESGRNLVIRGEIGTGRELIARAIHGSSRRVCGAFVPVNLFGIPKGQADTVFFGRIGGALVEGAPRRGLFEEADGGTLFLREPSDLDAGLQEKFARVLTDREITPLGGKRPISLDLRIICATKRDLEAEVVQGRFRKDLYEKLNGLLLTLPSLRERREDIGPLAEHFTRKYAYELGKPVSGVDRDALEVLLGYDWPGNVRELQTVVERAVLVADGRTLGRNDFPQLSPLL
jgi:DNA-binding NtrC family response regulator